MRATSPPGPRVTPQGWTHRLVAALAAAVAVLCGLLAAGASPAAAASTFDMRSTWTVKIYLGSNFNNTQYWRITGGDPASGSYTGDTGTAATGSTFGTLTATVNGLSFNMSNPYTGGGYTATFTGTVAGDGLSMNGTWVDNGGQSGTITATRTSV
ncbi:MAG: hypothetical protein AB1416_13025, partial [Actinomycetota bacterium]